VPGQDLTTILSRESRGKCGQSGAEGLWFEENSKVSLEPGSPILSGFAREALINKALLTMIVEKARIFRVSEEESEAWDRTLWRLVGNSLNKEA
jgi:hypothetical protein